MEADEFERLWFGLGKLFPRAQVFRDDLAKVEWAAQLDQCVAKWITEAAEAHAKASEWPSMAGLMAQYATVSAKHLEERRLERLGIGTAPPERFLPPEHYDRAYESMSPLFREGIEDRLKGAYPAAYAGRETDPNLRWAWHCLVVAADERGMEADGRIPGLARRDDAPQWDASLDATRRQMIHEASCAKCRAYAEPPQSPTKANLMRERQGAPCPFGAAYWEPIWAAGMPRPTA